MGIRVKGKGVFAPFIGSSATTNFNLDAIASIERINVG